MEEEKLKQKLAALEQELKKKSKKLTKIEQAKRIQEHVKHKIAEQNKNLMSPLKDGQHERKRKISFQIELDEKDSHRSQPKQFGLIHDHFEAPFSQDEFKIDKKSKICSKQNNDVNLPGRNDGNKVKARSITKPSIEDKRRSREKSEVCRTISVPNSKDKISEIHVSPNSVRKKTEYVRGNSSLIKVEVSAPIQGGSLPTPIGLAPATANVGQTKAKDVSSPPVCDEGEFRECLTEEGVSAVSSGSSMSVDDQVIPGSQDSLIRRRASKHKRYSLPAKIDKRRSVRLSPIKPVCLQAVSKNVDCEVSDAVSLNKSKDKVENPHLLKPEIYELPKNQSHTSKQGIQKLDSGTNNCPDLGLMTSSSVDPLEQFPGPVSPLISPKDQLPKIECNKTEVIPMNSEKSQVKSLVHNVSAKDALKDGKKKLRRSTTSLDFSFLDDDTLGDMYSQIKTRRRRSRCSASQVVALSQEENQSSVSTQSSQPILPRIVQGLSQKQLSQASSPAAITEKESQPENRKKKALKRKELSNTDARKQTDSTGFISSEPQKGWFDKDSATPTSKDFDQIHLDDSASQYDFMPLKTKKTSASVQRRVRKQQGNNSGSPKLQSSWPYMEGKNRSPSNSAPPSFLRHPLNNDNKILKLPPKAKFSRVVHFALPDSEYGTLKLSKIRNTTLSEYNDTKIPEKQIASMGEELINSEDKDTPIGKVAYKRLSCKPSPIKKSNESHFVISSTPSIPHPSFSQDDPGSMDRSEFELALTPVAGHIDVAMNNIVPIPFDLDKETENGKEKTSGPISIASQVSNVSESLSQSQSILSEHKLLNRGRGRGRPRGRKRGRGRARGRQRTSVIENDRVSSLNNDSQISCIPCSEDTSSINSATDVNSQEIEVAKMLNNNIVAKIDSAEPGSQTEKEPEDSLFVRGSQQSIASISESNEVLRVQSGRGRGRGRGRGGRRGRGKQRQSEASECSELIASPPSKPTRIAKAECGEEREEHLCIQPSKTSFVLSENDQTRHSPSKPHSENDLGKIIVNNVGSHEDSKSDPDAISSSIVSKNVSVQDQLNEFIEDRNTQKTATLNGIALEVKLHEVSTKSEDDHKNNMQKYEGFTDVCSPEIIGTLKFPPGSEILGIAAVNYIHGNKHGFALVTCTHGLVKLWRQDADILSDKLFLHSWGVDGVVCEVRMIQTSDVINIIVIGRYHGSDAFYVDILSYFYMRGESQRKRIHECRDSLLKEIIMSIGHTELILAEITECISTVLKYKINDVKPSQRLIGEVNDSLLSLCGLSELKDALIGTAKDVVFIWNSSESVLLARISLPSSIVKCVSAFHEKGLVFLSVQQTDCNGGLVVLNPHTKQAVLVHVIETETEKRLIKFSCFQDSLMAILGTEIKVFSIVSGSLLRSCELPWQPIDMATIEADCKNRLLLAGREEILCYKIGL